MNHTMSSAPLARLALVTRQAALTRMKRENDGESSRLQVEHSSEEKAGAEVLISLSDRERRELTEIDAALGRIDAGTWGKCEKCKGSIGAGRLGAVPEARTCVACAS